ncbi:MAG: hypothetical protein HYY06_11340 [Deltaproteobacteria bacterium]|nr:hypothetical protein [Deltaproteobacteria bacterium]
MLREAEAFRVRVGPGSWWDLWHYHADWPGWGNVRWSYRLAHLRALAIVFRKVIDAMASIPTPFQTWVLLDVDDAGQDAVYIHSPNPNGSPFPLPTGGVWESAGIVHELMTVLLPGLELRVNRRSWRVEDEDGSRLRTAYLVYSPVAGTPLESQGSSGR